ncbi:type III polyketide synthase [Hyphobacterium sp. CCMP332]|nr:type III polyketide synthase [Hyphobacterium sp. CCMP332]
MNESYITHIGCANPEHAISQEDAFKFMVATLKADKVLERKLSVLYRQTQIDKRYTVVSSFTRDKNFHFNKKENKLFSTSERMQIYEKEALILAEKSVHDLKIDFPVKEITHLITFSCTGMYAPGLDIDLVRHMGLSPNIQRFNVNFMGCYAGLTVLKLADSIVKSDPKAKVLMVGVEICSIHFQKDLDEDFLLSNALFADGSAACIVQSQPMKGKNIKNESFYCELITEGLSDMAWHIRDFGFEMKLSSYIPKLLNGSMDQLLDQLEKDMGKESSVDHFAIHPGGRAILDTLSKKIGKKNNALQHSYDILRDYGNMSSVTVIFVLKRLMESLDNSNNKEKILSMAFGPGLTMESALLEFAYV